MDEKQGLRERKKLRTRAAISDAAIALFLRDGFDQVSVVQVAEAAEVPELTARLAAVQIVAVYWELAKDNAARLAHGESADAREAGALADAEHAFALLETGLGRLPKTR